MLSPVFDDKHFSLRVNPTESKNYEGILETTTRDFLLNTYHWCSLLSTRSIKRIRDSNIDSIKQFQQFNNDGTKEDEVAMDIGFFGISDRRHHRSQWQWTRLKDIYNLFKLNDEALESLEEEYEFFGIKGDISPESFHNQKVLNKAKKRLFVIFIDSLDMKPIRESAENEFPNIRKIARNATEFSNFTSSGDWTIPCLDALHRVSARKYIISFSFRPRCYNYSLNIIYKKFQRKRVHITC